MALWSEQRKVLMNEGDFGLTLPFVIDGIDILLSDKVEFIIKKNKDTNSVVTKEYSNDSTVVNKFVFSLEFTQEESNKLSTGNYIYFIKLIRNNELNNTIIAGEPFVVREGAK